MKAAAVIACVVVLALGLSTVDSAAVKVGFSARSPGCPAALSAATHPRRVTHTSDVTLALQVQYRFCDADPFTRVALNRVSCER